MVELLLYVLLLVKKRNLFTLSASGCKIESTDVGLSHFPVLCLSFCLTV